MPPPPAGSNRPHFDVIRRYATPQQLQAIAASPEKLTLVRRQFKQLQSDPTFLAELESMLRDHGAEFEHLNIPNSQLRSFGWEPSTEMPSPKQAAAAVGAAAAALAAAPVPI